ncbi:MAG: hypothetical protein IJT30_05870 [Muribaculaceae bacterium]|nr:hypothetical protein [Muribaculaceae bacterium]
MLKEISRDLIRGYLDDVGVSTRIDDDGDIFTLLRADENFNHDVAVFFNVNGNWLWIFGQAHNLTVEESDKTRVLKILNEHNRKAKIVNGYMMKETIRFEHCYLLDEEVSEAYIKENCLRMTVSAIWHSFCDFGKAFG